VVVGAGFKKARRTKILTHRFRETWV